MNIMIFSSIYPSPAACGIPNDTKVVHYYAKQWQNEGHRVRVVYLHFSSVKRIFRATGLKKIYGMESDYEYEGIPVHLLDYQLLFPGRNYLSAFQAKNAERRILKWMEQSFVPDKVFVHFPCSFKGIACVSAFDCPTMAVLHNVDIYTMRRKKELCGELNRYRSLGGRNANICRIASEQLLRECALVLSGIDESLIPPVEWIRQKASQTSDCIRIVYAGNLIKLKKVDVVLKALEQVDFAYRLDIIGDGPEKNKLMTMASGNENIVFRGRMSREATIDAMREADVFVMVSSPETFGLVYLEAMAQGCITVGSRGEGIDGVIVDGKNGFLVPPGNADELAARLKKIAIMSSEEKQNMVFSACKDAASMTDLQMGMKYFHMNV